MQRWFMIALTTFILLLAPCFSTMAQDLDACREAVRTKPDDAEAHHSLGVALYRTESYKEAVESNRRAIDLEPGFIPARVWLGLAYLQLGDMESARGEYEKLKDIDKDEAKKLKKLIKSFEEDEKGAEKARRKAEKEVEKAEREAVKEARKQEKERLKKKAKILGVSVRMVQEQEFWGEFWERYRQADPETRAVMRYQMELYMRKREVEAQEETARAIRDAAASSWMNPYQPSWYDPYYCW